MGKAYLYFGCRQSGVDNIYAREIEAAKKEGAITGYHVALSREPGKLKVGSLYRSKIQNTDIHTPIHTQSSFLENIVVYLYLCGIKVMDDCLNFNESSNCKLYSCDLYFQTYVQDVIQKHKNGICDLLFSKGAHLYICGDSDMALDVVNVMVKILQETQNMTLEQATHYVTELKVM